MISFRVIFYEAMFERIDTMNTRALFYSLFLSRSGKWIKKLTMNYEHVRAINSENLLLCFTCTFDNISFINLINENIDQKEIILQRPHIISTLKTQFIHKPPLLILIIFFVRHELSSQKGGCVKIP